MQKFVRNVKNAKPDDRKVHKGKWAAVHTGPGDNAYKYVLLTCMKAQNTIGLEYYSLMSHVMWKTIYAICEQQRRRSP